MKLNNTQRRCISKWIRAVAIRDDEKAHIPGTFQLKAERLISFEAFYGHGSRGGVINKGWRIHDQVMKLAQMDMFKDWNLERSTQRTWNGWGLNSLRVTVRATGALIDFIKTQWIWKSDNDAVGYEFGPELPSCARLADRAIHGSDIKFI